MDEPRKHILITFDESLNDLRQNVLMMAALSERSLATAMRGLFDRNEELCNSVIADDESIDQLEKQVDKEGITLLTRFQPLASDLRQIVSAMKISNNLERIADQAVNIARKARKLNQNPPLPEVALLRQMYENAAAMFTDSINAYTQADVPKATGLIPRDKRLDMLNAEIAGKLTEMMAKNPSRIPDYLNLMFISRHLERVGDHATNIAEDTVYAAAAEDIRHSTQGPAAHG